ncbi:MAG: hypothetical protein QG659_86 [Patescibacteria group bacterium]|nr:hypothetical protein [Patescibacteria group bacterium]
MKNILKLFPSPAVTLSFFILPVVFSIYYVVTRFSDRFIAEQEITYFDVQNSLVGTFFVTQGWLDWFNRFMDFALWGMLAGMVLIAAWLISSARTAFKNHETETKFRNFTVSKESWHGQFIAVAAVKILLIVVMLFCFFSLLGQAIPLLAANIATLLQSITTSGVLATLYSVLIIVFLQFLFATSIRVFKLTHADE